MINAVNQKFKENGLDLTIEQWRVLMVLYLNDGIAQHDVSQVLDQEKTGVSRLLNGLENKNYVVRVRDQLDARRRRLYVSNKARTMMPVFLELAGQALAQAAEGVTEEEMAACKKVLNRVIRNLT